MVVVLPGGSVTPARWRRSGTVVPLYIVLLDFLDKVQWTVCVTSALVGTLPNCLFYLMFRLFMVYTGVSQKGHFGVVPFV